MRYSVIIPTYNRAGFFQKAVDSVLAQSFKDFELIIIDDGSSDETAALVKSYSDTRIKYIYQNNGGVSSARNRALKESSGDIFKTCLKLCCVSISCVVVKSDLFNEYRPF